MKLIRSGVLLCCGIWVGQAAAVNVDGYDIPYAAAQYAHEFSASSRDSDGGNGYQLTFGMPLDMLNFNLPFSKENTAAEVSFYDVGRKREIDGNKDYQTVLAFDLVRDFGTYDWKGTETGKYLPKFKPFGLIGLEAIREDVRGDNHYHAGINAGGGLLFPLPWYGAAVRAEGRLQLQSNTKSVPDKDFLTDFRLTLGVQIPLSFLFKPQAVQPQKSCDVAVVPVNGAPRTNCDKVADKSPCAIPAAGAAIDANGCAVGLKSVRFEVDSATLTEESKAILDEVALNLVTQKDTDVRISGYTDTSGGKAYNQTLSNQRAESVRQYLIAKGIDAKRMTTRGFGAAQPEVSNETEQGRETNRRAEIQLVE